MRRHTFRTGLFLLGFFGCWLFSSLAGSSVHVQASAFQMLTSLTPTIGATATPATHVTNQTTSTIDSTTWAAIITAIAAIIAALISVFFGLHALRRTAQMDKAKKVGEQQHEIELERLRKEAEEKAATAQRQHEIEMLRLQLNLERQSKAQEQTEQREAEKAEQLRLASLQAQTTEERVTLYRKSLSTDPRISCMQILSMSRPFEIANVYIQVRLHEEVRPGYRSALNSCMRWMNATPICY